MSKKYKVALASVMTLIISASISYFTNTQKNTSALSEPQSSPQIQEVVEPPKPQSGLIREILIQYTDGYVAQKGGEICQLIQGTSDEPPLMISKAQDMWLCQTQHFNFKTNNVKETLESLNEQWEKDKESEKQGISHFYEIEDWTYVYANLLTRQEVLELQNFAKTNGPLTETAKRVLHSRSDKK